MRGSGGVRAGWLFGPVPDLLFGCGGLYLCALLAFAIGGAGLRDAEAGMHWLGPLLVLMIGAPHYGATILRVYEQRADRRAYVFFAVHATLLIAGAFVFGLYQRPVAVFLITLYLTWSPWHYSGQNYGIALMFLGRRGVGVDATTKRFFYTSFLLSYAIAFLGTHALGQSTTYAPASLDGATYRLIRLGIPQAIFEPALLAVCGAYLATVGIAIRRLARAGSWSDLAPALSIVALQAVWFSIPALFRMSGLFTDLAPFDPRLGEYAFLWIAIGHALQYLWVTRFFASAANPSEGTASYYGKTLLAGGAIWGIPLIAFGPDLLGVRAVDAGLGLLVAAGVNVHHFVLDGAIWKLRQGRIANVLILSLIHI